MATLLPQYPISEEDGLAASTQPVNVPSEMTFAQEVRSERLAILWKVTLFGAFIVMWLLVVISGGRDVPLGEALLPAVILMFGCLTTGQLLRRNMFMQAVWVYATGSSLAIGFAMGSSGEFGKNYIPFVFPMLVFVVGLLLPVRHTLFMTFMAYAIAIGMPMLMTGDMGVSDSTIFALVMTTIAAALSAQVSGELFAIAEWALENYRKERRTTFALFESRLALEKSFHRQTALTQQLQDANTELEGARKSAEEAKNFRGQFLANMSHELRTPLNAIIGFSQTMLDFPAMYDGVELPVQYRQDMNQILSSGKHLLTIINDILDLSKVDAGKLDLEIQPVDLGPVVKGVLSTAVGLVGDKARQVQLLRELPDPLPTCLGDPLRVRQVLLNLYSNAAKFTDSGYIKLRIFAEGQEVVFAVEDTGIGIMEADKASIFEEFRQGTAGRKKGRQGAGLGLAISQQLLRLMNGRVWFESVLGKGSTFFVALPLYVPEKADAPAAALPGTGELGPVTVSLAPKPEAVADVSK